MTLNDETYADFQAEMAALEADLAATIGPEPAQARTGLAQATQKGTRPRKLWMNGDILDQVDQYLYSEVDQRIPYGALARLVEELLAENFKRMAANKVLSDRLRGAETPTQMLASLIEYLANAGRPDEEVCTLVLRDKLRSWRESGSNPVGPAATVDSLRWKSLRPESPTDLLLVQADHPTGTFQVSKKLLSLAGSVEITSSFIPAGENVTHRRGTLFDIRDYPYLSVDNAAAMIKEASNWEAKV